MRRVCNLICCEINARIPLTQVVAQCWICFVALAGGVGHRASWLARVWPGGGADSSAQRGEPPPVRTHHRHPTVACCLDLSLMCCVKLTETFAFLSLVIFVLRIDILVSYFIWQSKLDNINFFYIFLYLLSCALLNKWAPCNVMGCKELCVARYVQVCFCEYVLCANTAVRHGMWLTQLCFVFVQVWHTNIHACSRLGGLNDTYVSSEHNPWNSR